MTHKDTINELAQVRKKLEEIMAATHSTEVRARSMRLHRTVNKMILQLLRDMSPGNVTTDKHWLYSPDDPRIHKEGRIE